MEQQVETSRVCPGGDGVQLEFDPELDAEWEVRIRPCPACGRWRVAGAVSYLEQGTAAQLQDLLHALVAVGNR